MEVSLHNETFFIFMVMKSELKYIGILASVAMAGTLIVSTSSIVSMAQKANTSLSKQKTQLENKKKHLSQEIANANKELTQTSSKQKKTVQYIGQLSNKISFREELVETYKDEVKNIESEMEIQKLRKSELIQLENKLRDEYAKMVFFAYKNRNTDDKLLYVLASENMNQAFARARFFNQLAGFRRVQLAQLSETKINLDGVITVLDSNRIAKNTVLKLEESEKQKLQVEKEEQQKLAQQLKGKEAEIRNKIKKNEKERIQLESKIQELVRKIIEEERKKAEAAALAAKKKAEADAAKKAASAGTSTASTSSSAKPSTTSTTTKPASTGSNVNVVTPETRLKSASFEGNKGAMPWPVEKGAITGKYGVQAHPYLSGVTIKNDGVDISSPSGSTARVIYDGEVSGIFAVDGYGKVVIIKHGEYYSVYSNLSDVVVSKGAQLKMKQKIGSISTSENGKAVMNFQIRKGSQTLNPASWLAY